MLGVLAVTSPIYLIIALGYALGRAGLFDRAALALMSRFVVTVAIPALIFRALHDKPIAATFSPTYTGAYLAGTLALVALTILLAARAGQSRVEGVLSAMGSACANSGFVGYPVLLLAIPSVAGPAWALNMVIEVVFVTPLLLLLAERASGGAGARAAAQALARLLATPMFLALPAALLASGLGLKPPAPLAVAIDMMANIAIGLSLFVIGGSLAGVDLRGAAGRIGAVTFAKLALHPLFVAIAFLIAPRLGLPEMERPLMAAGIAMAAMPSMSIYPVLAARYGEGESAAAVMFATTVLSFPTITVLLWIFAWLGWSG